VAQLESDPSTNWTTVNISALREHLMDMDALFLRAQVAQKDTPDGFQATVTGDAGVLAAANRMVPEHVTSLASTRGRVEDHRRL